MRLIGLAVVGLALIGARPAFAQYDVPRPVVPIGPPAVDDVSDIIQAMGLDPMGQPMRSGPFYVQRATDDLGRVLRVTVDARRSQVIAVEPAGAPGHRAGPHAAYGPYGRPSYPIYGALPDDDAHIAPPGSIVAPQGQGPHAVVPQGVPQPPKAPRPAAKSAAVTPNHPPVPRKRPAAAPQDAVGSVEPIAPAASVPQVAPQNSAPQVAPAPAKPAESSMPPVAPLE